jgi:hypothetical protein
LRPFFAIFSNGFPVSAGGQCLWGAFRAFVSGGANPVPAATGMVVGIYEDAGISSAKGRDKRPGFDQLMRDATARKVNMIAAWWFFAIVRAALCVSAQRTRLLGTFGAPVSGGKFPAAAWEVRSSRFPSIDDHFVRQPVRVPLARCCEHDLAVL